MLSRLIIWGITKSILYGKGTKENQDYSNGHSYFPFGSLHKDPSKDLTNKIPERRKTDDVYKC